MKPVKKRRQYYDNKWIELFINHLGLYLKQGIQVADSDLFF